MKYVAAYALLVLGGNAKPSKQTVWKPFIQEREKGKRCKERWFSALVVVKNDMDNY